MMSDVFIVIVNEISNREKDFHRKEMNFEHFNEILGHHFGERFKIKYCPDFTSFFKLIEILCLTQKRPRKVIIPRNTSFYLIATIIQTLSLY